MSEYRKHFNETKYMSSLMKDGELLKKYNKILDEVSNSIKRGFDNEPVYNEQYLKTKVKFYKGQINTNFHGDRIPKEGSHCVCLSVILIYSIFEIGKLYYPQVFLEECITRCITDNLEISSDDSDIENSDEED